MNNDKMNSMIFLFSLISFVSLCQGQNPAQDGTAAVDTLVTKLVTTDANGVIKDALTEALGEFFDEEKTNLKAAASLIPNIGIQTLGVTVIAGATATTPAVVTDVAIRFLESVLVTFNLDKPLVITPEANQFKALNALATGISPPNKEQIQVLRAGIHLLSAADLKSIGSGIITAAAGTDIAALTAAVTTYLTNIESHTTTIKKLILSLVDGLTGAPSKLMDAITTAYVGVPLTEKTELQNSIEVLTATQIQAAGADLITAVNGPDPVPTDTVTTFFTNINSVANSSPVTQCSVTLLIASVAGAALYRSIGSL